MKENMYESFKFSIFLWTPALIPNGIRVILSLVPWSQIYLADSAESLFILIYILEDNLFDCFNRTFLLYGLSLKVFILNQVTAARVAVKIFIECFKGMNSSLLLDHCFRNVGVVIDELGSGRFLYQILFFCCSEFLGRNNKQIGLSLEKLRGINIYSARVLLIQN